MISNKHAVRPQDARVLGVMEFVRPRGLQQHPMPVPRFPTMRINNAKAMHGDYHSGPTRTVRPHESSLLEGSEVWNERAVSICIAQELYRVVELCDMDKSIDLLRGRQMIMTNGLAAFLGQTIGSSTPDNLRLWQTTLMAAAVGCNVLIDDPSDEVRELMGNGNVLTFVPPEETEPGSPPDASLIISSYNKPCGIPGQRAKSLMGKSAPEGLIKHLELYRGWLAGVYAPGVIEVGSSLEVNVAPTTPPLPE